MNKFALKLCNYVLSSRYVYVKLSGVGYKWVLNERTYPTSDSCLQGRIQGECPGCPDTRPLLRVPFFEKNIFKTLFLAEQGASGLMIFDQRCALLINFRIKFNLIFAGAPSIHSPVAVLSMLLFNTNSNVIYAF